MLGATIYVIFLHSVLFIPLSAGLSEVDAFWSRLGEKSIPEFHWNASFAYLNIARLKTREEQAEAEKSGFSMKSLKQRAANE